MKHVFSCFAAIMNEMTISECRTLRLVCKKFNRLYYDRSCIKRYLQKITGAGEQILGLLLETNSVIKDSCAINLFTDNFNTTCTDRL